MYSKSPLSANLFTLCLDKGIDDINFLDNSEHLITIEPNAIEYENNLKKLNMNKEESHSHEHSNSVKDEATSIDLNDIDHLISNSEALIAIRELAARERKQQSRKHKTSTSSISSITMQTSIKKAAIELKNSLNPMSSSASSSLVALELNLTEDNNHANNSSLSCSSKKKEEQQKLK
jgi:hypothetical protein